MTAFDPTTGRPKYVGRPVQRAEDLRLLAGAGRYTADIRLDRMVHVAFLRSDQAHARIAGLDTSEAAALPGVLGVYTAADFNDIPAIVAPSRMKNYRATTATVLAAGKVRYVGEPVAVVVARDRYIAEDAVALIVPDYEPLGTAVDPVAALAGDAPLLHEELGTNVILEREFRSGEPEQQLAEAPVIVAGQFRIRRRAPLAMETRCYVADFDRGREALTLYSSTQIPGVVRDALAKFLDLPGSHLRVVAPDVGGGFGGKGSVYGEEIVIAELARRLRRPVRWAGDRLEDLTATSQAFDEIVEASLGVDEEGQFIALDGEVIGDIGAYSIYPWTAALEPVQVVSFLPGPYRIPHYRGHVRGVSTSKPPTGPYRGVGRPPAVFVLERLIDVAARRLGMDPAEIRRRNLVAPDGFPHRIGSGIIWDRSGFTECLEKVCEAGGYVALRRHQMEARAAGRWVGVGLACYAELTGIGSRISVAPGMPLNTGSETATVRVDGTGAVTAIFATASQGQSLETTLGQIVAEEVGVRPEDVTILHGDTAATASGTGTYASRSAVIGGGAALQAGRSLRQKIKRAAAHVLEAAEEDLETANGRIFVTGTDRAITFAELAKAVYADMKTLPVEAREPLEATETFDPITGTTTSATHLAMVEIDPETFKVRIDRYLVAEDCGRLINPLVVDGQVHGGVAQGVGTALLEELQYDETGQLLTATLADYLVPTAVEIPDMEVHHLETELPDNPGGFRGMGEGGTIGAPAAIANAIADALAPYGIEINELPVTPEKLFQLVRAARARQQGEASDETRA